MYISVKVKTAGAHTTRLRGFLQPVVFTLPESSTIDPNEAPQ